jgi:hypothetical protein
MVAKATVLIRLKPLTEIGLSPPVLTARYRARQVDSGRAYTGSGLRAAVAFGPSTGSGSTDRG